jgi:hypothetical protein
MCPKCLGLFKIADFVIIQEELHYAISFSIVLYNSFYIPIFFSALNRLVGGITRILHAVNFNMDNI